MKFEAVGVGRHKMGHLNGWAITYVKGDHDGDGMPDFHHHLMPDTIFVNYALQFGLDPEEDFDEIFEIVTSEVFAGNDEPEDDVDEGPQLRTFSQTGRRKNALGRKYARRAERANRMHEITGKEAIKERIRPELAGSLKGINRRPRKAAPQKPGAVELVRNVEEGNLGTTVLPEG